MSRVVKIGNICIGGNNRIAIQSMTNTITENIDATLLQIEALVVAGCDIVRCSVNNRDAALAMKEICRVSKVPIVADIHNDYKLALLAAENGVAKLRINPGNIGIENVAKVAACCKEYGVPIRIGVNSGSIERDIQAEYGRGSEALVMSAMRHIRLLEEVNFCDIVVSIKASDVKRTIEANRIIAKNVDYPLHIGVTEAGVGEDSIVKSAVGLGSLLIDGIGDTLRVSITGDPVTEVSAAQKILRACGLDNRYVEIISCPTCARCSLDNESIVNALKLSMKDIKEPLKIAVMGCAVNGPGEASDCDIGVAGAPEKSALFMYGKVIGSVNNDEIVATLNRLAREIINIRE